MWKLLDRKRSSYKSFWKLLAVMHEGIFADTVWLECKTHPLNLFSCFSHFMLFDGSMQHSVNFDSFLFNQGPNSPKFHGNPPTLSVHTSLQSLCKQITSISTVFLQQPCGIFSSSLKGRHLLVLSSQNSKSGSCGGSWTPLRRRWRLWPLSWLPMWVCCLWKQLKLFYLKLLDLLWFHICYFSSCIHKCF